MKVFFITSDNLKRKYNNDTNTLLCNHTFNKAVYFDHDVNRQLFLIDKPTASLE